MRVVHLGCTYLVYVRIHVIGICRERSLEVLGFKALDRGSNLADSFGDEEHTLHPRLEIIGAHCMTAPDMQGIPKTKHNFDNLLARRRSTLQTKAQSGE